MRNLITSLGLCVVAVAVPSLVSAQQATVAAAKTGGNEESTVKSSPRVIKPLFVKHVTIFSKRSFSEVQESLEKSVPQLDPTLIPALYNGDMERAREHEEKGPKLAIFSHRNHGALLAITGRKRNTIHYEIGNPVTASKMTRHNLGAALYAPLRVILREDEEGRGVFEYDLPSSFFGQFGDERITTIGLQLDADLNAVLSNAAGI
ncbi:DUF302 domain-containing protein [Rhodoferax ferrireducens]|uniref:DUF302 domain-containing protein n=1 Tax=Rhodoferax ferrireducens TaxID=192843 RepID=UPI000E0D6A63|nr:DUF302 domain-containing protein [Rhodoferax ferrireducens]